MLREPFRLPEIVNIDGQDYLFIDLTTEPLKPPTQEEWEAAEQECEEWMATREAKTAETRLRLLGAVRNLLKLTR